MEPFNEATMFDVIQEIMNTEQLDHLSIEDQMLALDVADSIKRYKAIELDVFLMMYMMNINVKVVRLITCHKQGEHMAIQGVSTQSLVKERLMILPDDSYTVSLNRVGEKSPRKDGTMVNVSFQVSDGDFKNRLI